MNRRLNQKCYRLGLLFLSCILAGIALPVLAQEPDPPPRQSDRSAPVRTPVISQDIPVPGASPNRTQALIEVPVEADAYIASARPNENFESAALYVGYHNIGTDQFGAERSLIRLDLSSVSSDTLIEEAKLRLYMSFATNSDSDSMRIIIRQLTSAWDEEVVTWNSEPSWGAVRADRFVGVAEGWYEWDITGLVTEWISGQTPNHGIELIGDETIRLRERAFNSRETASNLYPRLIIRYNEETDGQAPIVTVDSLNEYSARNFTVSWNGTDPGGSGIDHYDVQFQIDGGSWDDWQIDTTETSSEFTGGESGRHYAFRARGIDNVGNVEDYGEAEASTTVDVRAPESSVEPLPTYLQETSFTITLQGSDVGSGVATYDVRYRINGGQWILWQQRTTATTLVFNALDDGLFEFEARAIDQAGLVEAFNGMAEAKVLIDANPPFIAHCCYLPSISR